MKHINKLILFLLFVLAKSATAQDIPGFDNSNYAGISGVFLQPACIADMRYQLDVTLVGVGFSFNNNAIGANTASLLNGTLFSTNGDFRKNYNEVTTSNNKSVGLNESVQLPSAAYSINKDISVGFSIRQRGMLNVDQMTPAIAHLAYTGLDNNDPQNKGYYNGPPLKGDGFNINELLWMEYALHYAQVIKDDGPIFFKVGGSLKLENGAESAYLYADNLTYHWKNSDTLSLFASHISYGQSESARELFNTKSLPAYLASVASSSVAVDLGAVFEWRPDYQKYTFKGVDNKIKPRRDQNKYKLRVGVSILDIGSIPFTKGTKIYDYVADTTNWNVHNIKFGSNPVKSMDSLVNKVFPKAANGNKNTFIYSLPTTLSFQIDYNILSNLYINFTSYSALSSPNYPSQVSNVSYYSITPRWDSKWFGAFLPLAINQYGQATLGAAFRVGPLIIGSSQIFSFLLSQYTYGMDFYMSIKVPIFQHKPKDSDICPTPGSPSPQK